MVIDVKGKTLLSEGPTLFIKLYDCSDEPADSWPEIFALTVGIDKAATPPATNGGTIDVGDGVFDEVAGGFTDGVGVGLTGALGVVGFTVGDGVVGFTVGDGVVGFTVGDGVVGLVVGFETSVGFLAN